MLPETRPLHRTSFALQFAVRRRFLPQNPRTSLRARHEAARNRRQFVHPHRLEVNARSERFELIAHVFVHEVAARDHGESRLLTLPSARFPHHLGIVSGAGLRPCERGVTDL